MPFWKDYLLHKIIDENHPSRMESRCLNEIQRKVPCTICKEVCPNHVFENDEPDWVYCDNCNVCVSACPTRALSPSIMEMNRLIEVCKTISGHISISCEHYEGDVDLKISCLAALSWEFLAFLGLNGEVRLFCGDCQNCKNLSLMSQFNQTKNELAAFFGDEQFQKNILISPSEKSCSRGLTRREAFTVLFSKSKATVSALLPSIDSLIPDGTIWRQLLIYRLKSSEKAYQWNIISVTDNCSICGLCEKLCPNKALHQLHNEYDTSLWHLALIPYRCSACNVCADLCPKEAIIPAAHIPISDPEKPIIHTKKMITCTRCHEPAIDLNQDGLCEKCQAELELKIFW